VREEVSAVARTSMEPPGDQTAINTLRANVHLLCRGHGSRVAAEMGGESIHETGKFRTNTIPYAVK
jgi:hypothetical protein